MENSTSFKIEGTILSPESIDQDDIFDAFVDFISDQGWSYCGISSPKNMEF